MFFVFNQKYAKELCTLRIGDKMTFAYKLRNPNATTWEKRFKVGAIFWIKEAFCTAVDLNSSNDRRVFFYRTQALPTGYMLRTIAPASRMTLDQSRFSVKIEKIKKLTLTDLHIELTRVPHHVR